MSVASKASPRPWRAAAASHCGGAARSGVVEPGQRLEAADHATREVEDGLNHIVTRSGSRRMSRTAVSQPSSVREIADAGAVDADISPLVIGAGRAS